MQNQTFPDRKRTFEMFPSLKMAYNYEKFAALKKELDNLKKKKRG